MSDTSFKKELADAIGAIREARADQKITVAEMVRVLAEVLEASTTLVAGYAGDDARFDQFVRDVEDVVREYVVKPDLPRVPDFVENILDAQLVAWVRPLLFALRLEVKPFVPPVDPDGGFVPVSE